MKLCIRCGVLKSPELFHKHKRMADGRLNKCAVCVKECVDEWRLNNPGCRAVEYSKTTQAQKAQLNFSTGVRNKPGQGRNPAKTRIRSLKYLHKRRTQTKAPITEWDAFVAEESFRLAQQRNSLTGVLWAVDHTIPLNHKNACGLHNGFNLQVVPASWNYKKGNRNMDSFWPIKPLGSDDGR